jgi:hypothetical protein
VLPGASNLCGFLRHETASEGLKTLSGSPQRAVCTSPGKHDASRTSENSGDPRHDARHSFVSLLAEVRQACHNHVPGRAPLTQDDGALQPHSLEAKRSAISAIDSVIAGKRSTQFPPQSGDAEISIMQ